MVDTTVLYLVLVVWRVLVELECLGTAGVDCLGMVYDGTETGVVDLLETGSEALGLMEDLMTVVGTVGCVYEGGITSDELAGIEDSDVLEDAV